MRSGSVMHCRCVGLRSDHGPLATGEHRGIKITARGTFVAGVWIAHHHRTARILE